MKKIGFILIALFFVLMPLMNAQPPPQQNVNTNIGLDIQITQGDIFENGIFHIFNTHVFNISDGLRVNDTSTSCVFHLSDNVGNHIINQVAMDYDLSGLDWDFNVTGGNFTRNGDYNYLIVCNATDIGGFSAKEFKVTPTGKVLETSDSITFITLTGSSILLFLLCLFGGIMLPFRNNRGEEDEIISINKLKYFKIGFLFLSYVLFIWILNLLFALSNNFSILTQYTGFFKIMFMVMNSMSYPIFVFMLILMGGLAWKDLQLKKLLERGQHG